MPGVPSVREPIVTLRGSKWLSSSVRPAPIRTGAQLGTNDLSEAGGEDGALTCKLWTLHFVGLSPRWPVSSAYPDRVHMS